MAAIGFKSRRYAGGSVAGRSGDRQVGSRQSSGFWSSCRRTVVFSVAVSLAFAPFTSVSLDVGAWLHVVDEALSGLGIYSKPGFSYPPLWGYLLGSYGAAARALGVPASSLGHSSAVWASLAAQTGLFANRVTSIGLTVLIKLPLIAANVATAWLIWHSALSLGMEARRARRATAIWLLSPLVIWEAGVHGAFDCLVGLVIAAAVLCRIQGRMFWCGVSLALGILLKVTPGFLLPVFGASCIWPLTSEVQTRPRAAISLSGGVVVGLFLGLLPLVGSGQANAAYESVFARAAVQPSVGGFSVLGIVALPSFSWLGTWAASSNGHYLLMSEIVDVLASLLGAAMWIRGPKTPQRLLAALGLVMTVVFLVGPLTNPQYFLWIAPIWALLAVNSARVRRGMRLLGLVGVLFELSLLGPFGIFGPSAQQFKIPSEGLVAASMRAVQEWRWFGVPAGSLAEFIVWMLGVFGLVAIVVGTYGGKSVTQLALPRGSSVLASSARVVMLGLAAFDCLGLVAGVAAATPPRKPSIRLTVSRRRLEWSTTGVSPGSVVSLSLARRYVRPHRVYFYDDPRYPDSGSSPFQLQSVANNLKVDMVGDGLAIPVETVNAVGLADVLNTASGPGSVVVVASGTLPSTVWSPNTDDVVPFMARGGTVAFAGDIPGYYSVRQAGSMTAQPPDRQNPVFSCGKLTLPPAAPLSSQVTVMGLAGAAEMLGGRGLLNTSWGWQCIASHPSPVATALGLESASLHSGPPVREIALLRGSNLGYTAIGRSSIAWIPRGLGGLLLFGGEVNGSALANDVAALLSTAGAAPNLKVVGWGLNGQIRLPFGRTRERATVVVNDPATASLVSRSVDTIPPTASAVAIEPHARKS